MGQMTNEGAFTLTETIISLMITTMVLMLSVPLFPLLQSPDSYPESTAAQLASFIQEEINQARAITVTNTTLSVIDKDHRQIVIEKYGKNVRRTVNGTGHELLLQNIRSITFKQKTNTIVLNVEMNNDEHYPYSIHLFHQ